MRCDEARARLSELYDGVLEGPTREAVEGHIAGCAGCRVDEAGYRETLDRLGRLFHRVADGASPERPFPDLAPARSWGAGWFPQALLAGAAAASLLILLSLGTGGERRPGSGRIEAGSSPAAPAAVRVASRADGPQPHPGEACSWREAAPEELTTAVSYPVIAADCLHEQFELVRATVRNGSPTTDGECEENVRLVYRSGARSLTLDQQRSSDPPCCSGEQLVLGEHLLGCLEEAAHDVTSLTWLHHQHSFRLEGEVGLAEAVQVAQAISSSFGGGY